MKLDDVCAVFSNLQFPCVGDDSHPDLELVLEVRTRVREALADDEFLVDCISHELRLVESGRIRRGLTPFFVAPRHGVSFALGYWPPGATPGPHEHTAWTVTAVCRNHLNVSTFDRAESYRRKALVPKNVFAARAGEVGYIYAPSIHQPQNDSPDWSLSMHLSSPLDGEKASDVEPPEGLVQPARMRPEGWDHPYTEVMGVRGRHREVHLLARTLLSARAPRAFELLERCMALASSTTRAMVSRALPGRLAPEPASRVLTRTHRDLRLRAHRGDGGTMLFVDAPDGEVKVIVASEVAHEALVLAATEVTFDVRGLPDLTDDERTAVVEMLEDSGLFKRLTT